MLQTYGQTDNLQTDGPTVRQATDGQTNKLTLIYLLKDRFRGLTLSQTSPDFYVSAEQVV